jgi:hypothetical protein
VVVRTDGELARVWVGVGLLGGSTDVALHEMEQTCGVAACVECKREMVARTPLRLEAEGRVDDAQHAALLLLTWPLGEDGDTVGEGVGLVHKMRLRKQCDTSAQR